MDGMGYRDYSRELFRRITLRRDMRALQPGASRGLICRRSSYDGGDGMIPDTLVAYQRNVGALLDTLLDATE